MSEEMGKAGRVWRGLAELLEVLNLGGIISDDETRAVINAAGCSEVQPVEKPDIWKGALGAVGALPAPPPIAATTLELSCMVLTGAILARAVTLETPKEPPTGHEFPYVCRYDRKGDNFEVRHGVLGCCALFFWCDGEWVELARNTSGIMTVHELPTHLYLQLHPILELVMRDLSSKERAHVR